jgi:hypothetical protein
MSAERESLPFPSPGAYSDRLAAPDLSPATPVRGRARAAKEQIAAKLTDLVNNMIKLADGVKVQKASAKDDEIFDRPPDRQANEYLIDRVLGKVSVRSERGARAGRAESLLDAAIAEAMQDAARRVLAERGCPQSDGPS